MGTREERYWNYDYDYDVMDAELKKYVIINPKFNVDIALKYTKDFIDWELSMMATYEFADSDEIDLFGFIKQFKYWNMYKKEIEFRQIMEKIYQDKT